MRIKVLRFGIGKDGEGKRRPHTANQNQIIFNYIMELEPESGFLEIHTLKHTIQFLVSTRKSSSVTTGLCVCVRLNAGERVPEIRQKNRYSNLIILLSMELYYVIVIHIVSFYLNFCQSFVSVQQQPP